MDVKIEDRKPEIEYFRMALNISEIGISYIQADLILRVKDKLDKLKGDFSMKDGVTIYHQWREEWQNYSKND